MFEAMLIACLMGDPNQCMTVTDTRGPYKTDERCEQRIVEMIISARDIWEEHGIPFAIVKTSCDKKNSI